MDNVRWKNSTTGPIGEGTWVVYGIATTRVVEIARPWDDYIDIHPPGLRGAVLAGLEHLGWIPLQHLRFVCNPP